MPYPPPLSSAATPDKDSLPFLNPRSHRRRYRSSATPGNSRRPSPSSAGAPDQGLIVSFGEMLINFVPEESGVSLVEALGFLKAPDGTPANVAIAVARLDGKAAFIGKLGDDEFRHMLAGILKENKRFG